MRPVPTRKLLAIAAAAVALSIIYIYIVLLNTYNIEDPDHGSHFVAAGRFLLWIFVGELAWVRRPANPLGRWMIAVGFAGFLFVPSLLPIPPTWTFGLFFLWLEVVLTSFVFLSFPDGRLRHRADRLLMAVIVVWWIVATIAGLAVNYSPALNPLFVMPTIRSGFDVAAYLQIVDNVGNVIETVTSVLIGLVIVRVATHWVRSQPAGRRVMTPVLIAAIAYVVVLAIQWLDVVIGPNAASELLKGPRGYLIAGFVGYALPISVLIGILRTRLARSSVADVVRELDAGVEPGRLETVLRRVLGDPALRLAYRLPDGGWVSPAGEPVLLPAPSQAVAVTMLGHGEPIAALIHDPSVGSDPELLSSVAAAARLALENERLQAEIRAQLAEVRASRARIVEAGLDARRKVERDLHDGAQQRLLALVVRLQMMRARASADETLTAMLTTAGEELEAAIAELRELARGLHPTVLIDEGLAPAVENLADRAMIPVEVTVTPERCSESCEAAAYFVVSEALANIARHARARQARISIWVIDGDLVVEVVDDGVGGASTEGSGLRGLADRVAAVGGVLTVDSPSGGGTRLSALMPCA